MDLKTLLRRHRKIRTLGIDDGPFKRGARGQVLVVGAVYSAVSFEGLLSTRVRQDGFNATDCLIDMIRGSKFQPQVHVVMLDGITLGGFNVVDLPRLADEIGLPCLAIMRKRPDRRSIMNALSRVSRPRVREELMDRAGTVHRAGPLFFQSAGVQPVVARRVITASVYLGNMPECLRAAHLIARGIVDGQSGRRA